MQDQDNDGAVIPAEYQTVANNDRILVTDQTRGVVWGAERPELLMTEGLALHDRRQTDSALINVSGPGDGDGGSGNGAQFQSGDDDLDQRTLPKGSAFVELYNPWANSPQRPRELYSRQADTAPSGDPVLDPAAPAYAPYRFNPVVGELNRFGSDPGSVSRSAE